MKSISTEWEIVDAIEAAAGIAYKQYLMVYTKVWARAHKEDPVLDILKANYELWYETAISARNAARSQYQANEALGRALNTRIGD